MSKDEYLITDTPLKALTVFAMPMILGSFFQQIYNMADSIIVGQFVGSSALAAVGACAALTNVFICVALGAGVGAGVLVSRYFGAREYGKMKTIVSTSLISFLLLSIVLGVFGFFFANSMMSGLQTPADILDDAVLYLRVYFVGFPFLFMYNILSTMFTSIGESKNSARTADFFVHPEYFNGSLDGGRARSRCVRCGYCNPDCTGNFRSVFVFDFLCIGCGNIKAPFNRFELAGAVFHASHCGAVGFTAVHSVHRYDDCAGSGKSFRYTGTRRVYSNDAGGKCFFIDLCIHRQCGFAVCFPKPWRRQTPTHQKRLPCGAGAGSCALPFIAFLVIETLHTQISSLFLGKDGTALAYQVSGDYMRWLGYFLIFMGIKMATDGVLRGLGIMRPFLVANMVNLAIRLSVALICAPRFGIAFVWLAVPAGWLANFLISYVALRRSWPTDKMASTR